MRAEYEAAGIAYDRPGARIERLGEAIAIVKGLFGPEPLTYKGEHYVVDGLLGVPAPVQRPHPPLLVGGGGPRLLRLAGREADIVGLNANLGTGDIGAHSVVDVSWEAMADKVRWAREGAAEAGRDPGALELSMVQWALHVDGSVAVIDEVLAKLGRRLGLDPAWLEAAPGVLVGSVPRCIEKLEELRERLGISYIQVHAGPRGADLEPLAPVIAALRGR
jgi:alkanesulfonate monooxygenase SsuD/methylene tetrahydromethanopterin reductase-like flavin-dependent oxidoreductase (luciferase family)